MESRGSPKPRSEYPTGRDANRYEELRELLTGPERRRIEEISRRLNDPVKRAEELSEHLPDAITLGTSRDHRIARALQPTIDTALKASAARNPKAIADAIFPVLGPAIRKAISAALTGMIQSLNHILNQSLSWQGLGWRLEALRSRKPFAEVVLLHTLVYRVEQIFLIHHSSGILLQHVVAENIEIKDPDLVSGMLTAIQDFAKDSFDADTGEMLDTLRMDGDHSVWIEHGPHTILAAVIRGMPPVELRSRFRELLDEVHRRCADALENFDGRTGTFTIVKPDLEDALTSQVHHRRKTFSPVLWLLAAVLVGLGVFWAWHAVDDHRHWKTLVSRLQSEQGILLTTAAKTNGRYYIAGFRDPLASNVEDIIAQSGLPPERIRSRWQPFFSLEPSTIIKRATLILQPPPTVQLTLSNGGLRVRGIASHGWIMRLRNQYGAIPGIQGYDDAGLIDSEMSELRTAIASLERQRIYFTQGRARLDKSQDAAMEKLRATLERIQRLYKSMALTVRIAIIGQADPSGRWAFNLELSQKRAQAVMSRLIQHHIDPTNMHIAGSTTQPAKVESELSRDPQVYRSVMFKAFIGTE
jgi:outer membrane protein OmpA-like peptidoglycan-associated protein